MKVLITGGGTGGHLYSGIAIAKVFKNMNSTIDIQFVGTNTGLENKVVPQEGYLLKTIRIRPLAGHKFLKVLASVSRFPLAVLDSLKILKDVSPDIVIGLGGYSSGPVVIMAALKGIPTVIVEQNVIPGVTNRVLSRFVDAIAINFKSSEIFFPKKKVYLTGNPIREGITSGVKEEALRLFGLEEGLFTILVLGGSAGAHRINMSVAEALGYLNDLKDRIQIVHQTGDKDFKGISEFYRSKGFKGIVLPFIDRMSDAYAVADLIVSRAGAGTLSEITACGKASILVPYPYAAKNHQEVNARVLLDVEAAWIILDRELNGERLASGIRDLMEDPERLWQMERASKRLGNKDGAKKVVDITLDLIRGTDSGVNLACSKR